MLSELLTFRKTFCLPENYIKKCANIFHAMTNVEFGEFDHYTEENYNKIYLHSAMTNIKKRVAFMQIYVVLGECHSTQFKIG